RPILHTASAVALGFGLTLAALAQQDTTAPPQVPAPQADAPALDPTSLPEVVARVNDEPIQRNALVSIAEGIVQQLRLTGQTPPPQDKAFYEEILDRLISSELVAQEGVSQGITISDADIDARIERLEQQ